MGYLYVKTDSKPRSHSKVSVKQKRIVASVIFAFGAYLLASVVLPIVSFQLQYSIKFNEIVSPLSARFYNNSSILGDMSTDYTQLSNWFNDDAVQVAQNTSSSPQKPSFVTSSDQLTYTIEIPKLKVKNAIVTLGSMDLKKSLIQYPQTALPGQLGNAVVFGHSVLPQFYNPNSYLTIFASLFKLKQGDEIYVNYDNVRYKYLVEDIYEVQPTDLSVLEQRFDGRYITLITCSPPGTVLRRLVVKAKIVDI